MHENHITEYKNYGFGEVPALPHETVRRAPIQKTQHDIDREHAGNQEEREAHVRTRAAEIEKKYGSPVLIQTRSGQRILIGGEALVNALANGGTPVAERESEQPSAD